MADQRTVIGNANRMMVAAGRAPTLTCLEDVIHQLSKTRLVIDAVQSGVGCNISVPSDPRNNEIILESVIQYLQNEVLQIDLSHISPRRVLQGCVHDVANLTEIVAALVCLEWQPDISGVESSNQRCCDELSDGMDVQYDTNLSLREVFATTNPTTQLQASALCSQSPLNALPPPVHTQMYTARSLIHPSAHRPTSIEPIGNRNPGNLHLQPGISLSGSAPDSPGRATTAHPSRSGEISAASDVRGWDHKHSRLGTFDEAMVSSVAEARGPNPAIPFIGNSFSHWGGSSAATSVHLEKTGSGRQDTSDIFQVEVSMHGWQRPPSLCSGLETVPGQNQRLGAIGAQLRPGTVTARIVRGYDSRSSDSCSYNDNVADGVRLEHCTARCGNSKPLHTPVTQDIGGRNGLSSCSGWSADSLTSDGVDQLKARNNYPMLIRNIPVLSQPESPGTECEAQACHPSVLNSHMANALHAKQRPCSSLDAHGQDRLAHFTLDFIHANPGEMNTDRIADVSRQPTLSSPVQHSVQQTKDGEESVTGSKDRQDKVALKSSLDEDDVVLAAVIQDILDDENDDENDQFTKPGSLVTKATESSVDVHPVIQQRDVTQQDLCPRMEPHHQANDLPRTRALKQSRLGDADGAGSAAAGADKMEILQQSSLASGDETVTDSEGSSPAGAPCSGQREDAWASMESADRLLGTAQTSSETQEVTVKQLTQRRKPRALPGSSPGNRTRINGSNAKKGKRDKLCRSRKGAGTSGKLELHHHKDTRKDLPCDNPWLPNGKSGVGLVSTAVSPVKKRIGAAARKNYKKKHHLQPGTRLAQVSEATLKAVHPIGGVRTDGGPTSAIAARWQRCPKKWPAQGRLETSLAHKLAHVVKLKEGSPSALSRQARNTALAEESTLNRAEAQQKLEEKLLRAQYNREVTTENKIAPLQDRAKRHAQTVQAHKATMILTEAVNVLEKTRQEQAVAEQKFFRSAFLQAIEAEKEALLDKRKDDKQHIRAIKPNQAQSIPCHDPSRSTIVDSMQSKISSLQLELKTVQHDHKENRKQEVNSSMDQLSLQLQKLYADAQKTAKGQRTRDCLVESIRKLVQGTIFTS